MWRVRGGISAAVAATGSVAAARVAVAASADIAATRTDAAAV